LGHPRLASQFDGLRTEGKETLFGEPGGGVGFLGELRRELLPGRFAGSDAVDRVDEGIEFRGGGEREQQAEES